jgi:hypothetical protein
VALFLFELIFWVISEAVPAVIEIAITLFKLVLWIVFNGIPDLLINVLGARWDAKRKQRKILSKE